MRHRAIPVDVDQDIAVVRCRVEPQLPDEFDLIVTKFCTSFSGMTE